MRSIMSRKKVDTPSKKTLALGALGALAPVLTILLGANAFLAVPAFVLIALLVFVIVL
jgi:hypothetical protein